MDEQRRALEQVRDYMRSQDGPLYAAWEQGLIGYWDDRELAWDEALDYIESPRDGEGVDWDLMSDGVDVSAVPVYRAVLSALRSL